MSPLFLFFATLFVVGLTIGVISRNRIVTACLLLPMAAFCAVGFLASFELQGVGWHVGYSISGLACLARAAWPWLPERNQRVQSS